MWIITFLVGTGIVSVGIGTFLAGFEIFLVGIGMVLVETRIFLVGIIMFPMGNGIFGMEVGLFMKIDMLLLRTEILSVGIKSFLLE